MEARQAAASAGEAVGAGNRSSSPGRKTINKASRLVILNLIEDQKFRDPRFREDDNQ